MLAFSLHQDFKFLPVGAMEEFDFRKVLVASGMIRQREWEYWSFPDINFQRGDEVLFQCCSSDIYDYMGVSLLQWVRTCCVRINQSLIIMVCRLSRSKS